MLVKYHFLVVGKFHAFVTFSDIKNLEDFLAKDICFVKMMLYA